MAAPAPDAENHQLHYQQPQYHYSLSSYSSFNNYGTTLVVILLLHVIYFLQWNTRRSRKEVCTNYDQLVYKKQFYRVAYALLSHPPVEGGERDINFGNNNSLPVVDTDNNGGERTRRFGRFVNVLHVLRPISQRIHQQILYPLMYGSLSGLPALTFVCHILWQCRALEELYDEHDGVIHNVTSASAEVQTAGSTPNINQGFSPLNGYTYLRVLVALVFTSVLVELGLSRLTLRKLDSIVDTDGFRTSAHQLLSQRAICSIAPLSMALLRVYDSHFPYTPAVFPFFRVSFLSSSALSLIMSTCILIILTRRIISATSIISGVLSGSLWRFGLTSFLGTRYWGNVIFFVLAFGTLLSLKAHPSHSAYLALILPCLDYVSWNMKGELPLSGLS